jgi:Protein of unknown function (DUF616)
MIVYTSIMNNYDTLREPQVLDRDVRYICITDRRPDESHGWEIRIVDEYAEHPRFRQRYFKILSHRTFGDDPVTLYIDGNFELLVDPRELDETYLADSDLALFRHPQRDGVYAELEACKTHGKDDPQVLDEAASRYRGLGLPERGFLYAGGFILRRHTSAIKQFNEVWHEELRQSTYRDQPALAYALWRTGLTPTTIDKDIWHNDLLNYYPHNVKNESHARVSHHPPQQSE